jgi:hypothetical protein
MPYIGSSGTKFHLDGPEGSERRRQQLQQSAPNKLAYVVIASALVLCMIALIRLGAAASASVAAVSAATPASSFSTPLRTNASST